MPCFIFECTLWFDVSSNSLSASVLLVLFHAFWVIHNYVLFSIAIAIFVYILPGHWLPVTMRPLVYSHAPSMRYKYMMTNDTDSLFRGIVTSMSPHFGLLETIGLEASSRAPVASTSLPNTAFKTVSSNVAISGSQWNIALRVLSAVFASLLAVRTTRSASTE